MIITDDLILMLSYKLLSYFVNKNEDILINLTLFIFRLKGLKI